jgi:hypothetical protein
MPALRSRVLRSSRVASQRPRRTPRRLVQIRALPAPAKTTQGLWDWAVIRSVVIWVLSPSSARKIVTAVEPKTVQAPEGFSAIGLSSGAGDGAMTAPSATDSGVSRVTAIFHICFIFIMGPGCWIGNRGGRGLLAGACWLRSIGGLGGGFDFAVVQFDDPIG